MPLHSAEGRASTNIHREIRRKDLSRFGRGGQIPAQWLHRILPMGSSTGRYDFHPVQSAVTVQARHCEIAPRCE